ncbi:16S rRNA (guanine(966)-N(2))-methyltransferase RsmD [Longibacter salinarum]|uniref:16S rRNA (Guanine(966)-N(2))-methyltransferase RsmD n=1 Tax=Longibacter salinarum TaxID=1850348 RepID=A0A2A8D171_9BACT|nr:RsmD family RNA methyltransferase [Longibacter salinarum]PEN14666.1 16S rRNA (guanine(966)-N(2))-methyltransferase RsmD [Longibacter salinarum]
MRIIAGRFRGHTIESPPGHLTRPSTARTRESLFALIDSRIYLDGAEVLDLFAGTGALGLEAISRGASLVTFVEQDAEVLEYARRNAQELGVEDQCIFINGDALTYLRRYNGPELDLILADPPYDLDGLRDIPDLAIPHLQTDGVLTLEHSSHDWFDEHPNQMTSRKYGRTIVTIFRPPLPPEDEESEAEGEALDGESEETDDLIADVLGASFDEDEAPAAPSPEEAQDLDDDANVRTDGSDAS